MWCQRHGIQSHIDAGSPVANAHTGEQRELLPRAAWREFRLNKSPGSPPICWCKSSHLRHVCFFGGLRPALGMLSPPGRAESKAPFADFLAPESAGLGGAQQSSLSSKWYRGKDERTRLSKSSCLWW